MGSPLSNVFTTMTAADRCVAGPAYTTPARQFLRRNAAAQCTWRRKGVGSRARAGQAVQLEGILLLKTDSARAVERGDTHTIPLGWWALLSRQIDYRGNPYFLWLVSVERKASLRFPVSTLRILKNK